MTTKRFVTLACLGLLAALGPSMPVRAQGLPPGSYLRSCTDVRAFGNRITALCRTRDGAMLPTELRGISRCVGDIANIDGQLRCNYGGGGPAIPGGSYRQTCRDIGIDGNTLVATCRRSNGFWRQTALPDFFRCRGDIANINGRLRCD